MTSVEDKSAAVAARLRRVGIADAVVRVAEDPYGGWRLLVIAEEFRSLSAAQRRTMALGSDDYPDLQWYDLVTREEYEPEIEERLIVRTEQLPLWPNALATSVPTENVVFLSDTDMPVDRPLVVTFFSLRGGVGRSTALASAARLLAKRHLRVLCVDMDLEAPGLGPIFGVEGEPPEDTGTVALLTSLDTDESPAIEAHLIRLSDRDELYCLPAGFPNADYARRLANIDPAAWYEEDRNPLRLLLDLVGESRISFDVVLLDARTGISPLNAPLLFDLSDIVIIVFFPHPQSVAGTAALTRALFAAKTRRPDHAYTPEPRFVISPVPPQRPAGTDYWEQRGKDLIASWLLLPNQARSQHYPQIDVEDVTHVVPYSEAIANSAEIPQDWQALGHFEPVADWIAAFVETSPTVDILAGSDDTSKPDALASLEFSTGIAEAQQPESFVETFLRTDVVSKAMSPDVPLVMGRKGSGKSAIFRVLQLTDENVVAALAPRGTDAPSWIPDAVAFEAIEQALAQNGQTWSTYWTFHIASATAFKFATADLSVPPWPGSGPVEIGRSSEPTGRLEFVQLVRAVLAGEDPGLLAGAWLDRLDKSLADVTVVLFDGLDTEFGLSSEERTRRTNAVAELLRVVDSLQRLSRIRVKVLLRDDIWRSVSLPNKSHFFGRAVTLSWDDQIDFLKVALKQAVRGSSFRAFAEARLPPAERALLSAGVKIDEWTRESALSLWRVLVGFRLAGGNTAYTHNWVWNRLADGTGAHSPRSLLQLFHLAKEREEQIQRNVPYGSSVIRPRALSDSLDEVSIEALEALREEFAELDPMFAKLQAVGRTPFSVDDFGSVRDFGLERLAIEVGLLSASVDKPDEVERYRVPELYRRALGMTRRGQV